MNRPTRAIPASKAPLHDLNAIVEAFEDAHARELDVELQDFLPDEDHPDYTPIAVELIRVDLERARSSGIERTVDDYRRLAPTLFKDPSALGQIAYEEFRLRRLAGEMIDVDEYARRFALDTASWLAAMTPLDAEDSRPTESSQANDASGITDHQLPAIGDQLAGFELVELLGRGAFGVVFRARQHDLARREVVLKLTALRSVEPQRLARLQHTNIMPIYSIHRERDWLGICMPYLGRKTLADVLHRSRHSQAEQAQRSTVTGLDAETVRPWEGPPPVLALGASTPSPPAIAASAVMHSVDQVVEWIAQLAEGLAHAHGRGIVHSDLKPANVLLADDGTPLLLDFNLSDDVSAAPAATLVVGGTLPYMAPEHLAATMTGGPVCVESDIFSLGVIFFELLTGRRPYPDREIATEAQLNAMIDDRQKLAPSIHSHRMLISPAVGAIVAHCLAPRLDDRYRSATQLAEDLRRHQQDLPLIHTREASIGERLVKWRRRNARGLRVAAIVGMILLVAGIGTLAVVRQNRIQNLEAATEFTAFLHDALSANLNLHSRSDEPTLKSIGRQSALAALRRFDVGGTGDFQPAPLFRRLSPAQQDKVRLESLKLKYALAETPDRKQKLVNELSDSPDAAAFLHGVQLLERGKFAEAAALWGELTKQDRTDPIRWTMLGNAYSGSGRLSDAEACYTAVIALQPQAFAGYLYRGQCRYDMRNYVDAEGDLTAVIELFPGMPCGLMNRALVWQALGEFANAERDATGAIDAGFNDPRALFVRANIRDALGDAAGAKADRVRGFALDPVDEFGWVARGIARLREDPERARQEFEAGLARYPDSVALQENLIHVYADRLQRLEPALEVAERRVSGQPGNPAALASRAVILARLGRRDDAHADAAHILKRPVSALVSLQLACVYAITARTDPADVAAAINYLRMALAADPRLAFRAAQDPDLDSIRAMNQYKSLMAAANQLLEPAAAVAIESNSRTVAEHNP